MIIKKLRETLTLSSEDITLSISTQINSRMDNSKRGYYTAMYLR